MFCPQICILLQVPLFNLCPSSPPPSDHAPFCLFLIGKLLCSSLLFRLLNFSQHGHGQQQQQRQQQQAAMGARATQTATRMNHHVKKHVPSLSRHVLMAEQSSSSCRGAIQKNLISRASELENTLEIVNTTTICSRRNMSYKCICPTSGIIKLAIAICPICDFVL